ncbi:alpha/beta hydrolase [bacterium]|nr:alpha/beta hydrolase [bacterium]
MVETPSGRLFTRSWPGQDQEQTPIVLLHDSLGSVELWRDFPVLLSQTLQRSVIAYDRLGYGRSDPHPGMLGDDIVESESGHLAALLQAMGVPKFIALGHSIGGEMAIACGSRLPGFCSAVIAIAAQAWLEEQTLASIASARELFSDPEQFERLRKYHGDKAQWVLEAWTGTWFRPSMRSWSILPELPSLFCPLLLIHGERDEFASLEQPRRVAELAAGPARLEILPDCGHLPQREQPDKVLALIADFLQ